MKLTCYILFYFSLSIISFGQTRKDITGLYGECPKKYFACEQIELKKDSTFEYGIFFDVGGWETWSGKWKFKDDTLILNSYKQPKDSTDLWILKMSYSFAISGFIIDMKYRVKKNKIYTWDFEKKCISKKRYLLKTDIKNKQFVIHSTN
jgi:hypothetical protein